VVVSEPTPTPPRNHKRRQARFPYEYRGLVALVLAVGVVIAIAFTAAGIEHLNTDETTLLATAVGAIVGALATYLGVTRDADPREEDEDEG
jgi:hypothetical protein